MKATSHHELSTFLENGYIIRRGALEPEMANIIRTAAERLLSTADQSHRSRFPHQGSMLPIPLKDPAWAELVSDPAIAAALSGIGGRDQRWLSGYVISKPPHAPRLWWHQDWWAWQHPISCNSLPAQVSVMIYPAGATERNGCLRVVPGSHHRHHPLHDVLPEAHSAEANTLPEDHPAFSDQSDEVSVPVEPGDVVICDVRLLHATFGNKTNAERPCVTLWYLPNFDDLPIEFKAHYAQHPCQPSLHERDVLPRRLRELFIPVPKMPELRSIKLDRTPHALPR